MLSFSFLRKTNHKQLINNILPNVKFFIVNFKEPEKLLEVIIFCFNFTKTSSILYNLALNSSKNASKFRFYQKCTTT